MQQSRRMLAVQSPIIPVIGELIRAHPGTISLGQGVVHYPPPAQAIQQAISCMADPLNHRYSAVEGIVPLRQRLTEKLAAENGIAADARQRVIVTAGGNMAFANAVLAIADAGDEIVLQSPCYFNHEMMVVMAGCRPVLVATDEQNQLRPGAIEAAITARTRAVVTVSPNNPTGAVYPESALRAVNETCRRRGVYHIHDEAYEYFTWDGARHFSPGSIDGSGEHTIPLYSLSKAYGFASWRIGYMVIPAHLETAVKKVQDTVLICPPVVSQFAALGALEAGAAWCRGKLSEIREVRQIVSEALRELEGICTVPRADGAFYYLLRVHTSMRDMDLAERLVREHGVAAIPGGTFGITEGCCLRIAYGALEKATAAAGIGRLVQGLKAIVRC